MKNDTSVEKPETQTIALLAGLSIGLGLAVHEVFFLVAAGVLLIRPVKRLERYVYELTDQTYEKLLQNGQRCSIRDIFEPPPARAPAQDRRGTCRS
jgi:hypothetical protein